MDILRVASLFAALSGVGLWILLAWLILTSNGFLVLLNFNGMGEGPLEMVVLPVFAAVAALGLVGFFRASP